MISRYIVYAFSAFLFACATPAVIDVNKVDDNKLSCPQIKEQIAEAERFEKEARGDRKATGKNVAAAIFFWPALAATYANTEEAIDAAKERKRNMMELYKQKRCS